MSVYMTTACSISAALRLKHWFEHFTALHRFRLIMGALLYGPRRFLMKSSSFIFLSGFTLGLYMSVLRRMMAKARIKMVSGFWNCRISTGLQTQYRWLQSESKGSITNCTDDSALWYLIKPSATQFNTWRPPPAAPPAGLHPELWSELGTSSERRPDPSLRNPSHPGHS